MSRQTKARIWFDNASDEQIDSVRADLTALRTHRMYEEDFINKYPFTSKTASTYISEIDGDTKVPSVSCKVSPGQIIDSIKADTEFKVTTIEVSQETSDRLKSVCKIYRDKGVKTKYVLDYIIAKALDMCGEG